MKLNWKESQNQISIYFTLSKTVDHFPVATEKMVELTISEEISLECRWTTKISSKSITNNKRKMFWTIHTLVKNFYS